MSPRLLAANACTENARYVEKKKPEVDPRESGWQRISVLHKPLDADSSSSSSSSSSSHSDSKVSVHNQARVILNPFLRI